MIGALMYLLTCTRPNLTFYVLYLSQFSFRPLDIYHTTVKRVFRYISDTRSYILIYLYSGSIKLKGFSNTSFANCLDTYHSYTGYVI